MTIGQSMRKARKNAKLTIKELAEKSGYSRNNIQGIETDIHTPRISTVIDIADALGVSIDELVGHEVKGGANSES